MTDPPFQENIKFRKNTLERRWHFVTPHLFFECPLEMLAFPFKPYYRLTPADLLILCSEVITVTRWRLAGVPSVMSSKAQPCLGLSLQVPGAHQESLPLSSLCGRSVIWFIFWPTCVSFLSSYVFYILREAIDLPGKVPCGRHFRILQNQPEHAPGWLGSKSHWLILLLLVFLVILKFPGNSD